VDAGEKIALELELPEGERRERLLQALSRVIALRGHETFLCAPILLPSKDFFPEAADRTLEGAGVLVLRLLRYARLHPLPVLLTGYRERSARVAEGISLHDPRMQTAAWYAGVHEGVCHFGLELSGLRDDAALVAALSHEVTHAYRDRHTLAVRDRDVEEKLTDLTAVFLGFGVFLLNASHRVDSGGYAETGERLLYQRHSLGYLSPAEFALLLAAQVAARGLDARARRSVREALSPNHARLFELGVQEFSQDLEGLRRQLGLPEASEWPPAWPLAADELDLDELEVVHPRVPVASATTGGAIAFRVIQSQAALYGVLALFACLLLGTVLNLEGGTWLGLFALGLLGGGAWGATRKVHSCSACRGRLHVDDARCAKCRARLVGSIDSFDERLVAEENFHEAEKESRRRAAQTAEPAPNPGSAENGSSGLISGLFLAWVLTRGLARAQRSEALEALIAEVQAGKIDAPRLREAWHASPHPFSKEAAEFATYYFEHAPPRIRRRDYEILHTAHELRADRGSLQRYSAILDRRLEEWRARGDGEPNHVS
jgi:hypothetical protein